MENPKFKKFDPLENMMLNITEEGAEKMWKEIEFIKHPIKRLQQKDLYFKALKKLEVTDGKDG